MGNNYAYSIVEEQIVKLYDAGLLTLPVLDILCEPFRGSDIDSGGSQDLESKDGKSMDQICVELVNPEFKPNEPAEGEEWDEETHWGWYDEFSERIRERWGWR